MDNRIPLEQGSLSYGTSSLGSSLCAATLLHILPLGGLLFWQEMAGEVGEVSNKYPTPMTIELVYENQSGIQKEDCVIKPKAEEELKKPEINQPLLQKIQPYNPLESSIEDTLSNAEEIILRPSSNNQKPNYPLRAREEFIQGTVYLRITINPSGRVISADPLEPRANPLLEKAALDAVIHWTYVLSGPSRTSVRRIPIIFELEK